MTSEQNKPREFTLYFFYGSAKVILKSEKAFIKNEETIDVIEYSAYKNAMAHSDHSCAVARAAYEELAEVKQELVALKHGDRVCSNCGASGQNVEKSQYGYKCSCGCEWASVEQLLLKELAEAKAVLKDHQDDWKRIQDAEHALAEAKAEIERLRFDHGVHVADIQQEHFKVLDERDRWKEQAEKLASAMKQTHACNQTAECIALVEFEKFKGEMG